MVKRVPGTRFKGGETKLFRVKRRLATIFSYFGGDVRDEDKTVA